MKSKIHLILLIILTVFYSCSKDELGNLEGLTFTIVSDNDSQSSFSLSSTNIVNDSEIMGYDTLTHTFLFDDKAKNRILDFKTSGFAVAVGGEIIYFAQFIPGYSSQSCETCIRIEPYSLNNTYRVELGYPGGVQFPEHDPRNHYRIIGILKKDNRLITID